MKYKPDLLAIAIILIVLPFLIMTNPFSSIMLSLGKILLVIAIIKKLYDLGKKKRQEANKEP